MTTQKIYNVQFDQVLKVVEFDAINVTETKATINSCGINRVVSINKLDGIFRLSEKEAMQAMLAKLSQDVDQAKNDFEYCTEKLIKEARKAKKTLSLANEKLEAFKKIA